MNACMYVYTHKRTRDDIAMMAQDWEETPLYTA